MSRRVQVLGKGVVNWQADERICDRYGYVHLADTPMRSALDPGGEYLALEFGELLGTRVVLKALVLETRRSPHVGDLAHSIRPETPEQGDLIELGRGTLVTRMTAFGPEVGVEPEEWRSTWWLNPRALYRVHNQMVQLIAEELET